MKKINLRDYYPFYTTDTIVEVPDEVADLLHEYKLNEAAYILRTYRHKAYFSLDYDANVERDALVIVLTPAESDLCALFSWHEQIGYCKSGGHP